jgi:N-dimethylarginine dimethylaminohydrolase
MCPPEHFAISYAINPWMDPEKPADAAEAMRQWARLRQTYLDLGHDVWTIEPVAGLPDMVFAANGGTVIGGTVLGARFRHPQRAREADAYLDWFRGSGYPDVRVPDRVNEGEGDILFTGRTVLAGYGFRSDQAAAAEVASVFGRPVVSLHLVDPRFYHLDTALCVLDGDTAMYYPAAFDDAGRAAIAEQFTELIEAKDEDAEVLGLNAVSGTSCCRCRREVSRPSSASAGSSRSEWTCPSCSRAAADPSAARWSCAGSKMEGTS